MGKTEHQKELLSAWRERTVVGGVCAIRCTANNRVLLSAVADPAGLRNRFQFSAATGSCTFLPLATDWNKYGGSTKDTMKSIKGVCGDFGFDLPALSVMYLKPVD